MGYVLSQKDIDNPDNKVLEGNADFKVSVYMRHRFASTGPLSVSPLKIRDAHILDSATGKVAKRYQHKKMSKTLSRNNIDRMGASNIRYN